MGLRATGKAAIQKFIDDSENNQFDLGNIRGKIFSDWYSVPKGRLDHEIATFNDFFARQPVAVLFSFATPIAWRQLNEKDWFVPEVGYSKTTTNHQNVARMAIDNPGFYGRMK